MKKPKIIILLGIILGSNLQIEAMFARLTTQGAKIKPPTITRVPSQVSKRDTTTSSPKKTDTSPTSSEKSTQTQVTQTSGSKAPKKKESLYARSSESTQGSDENAAPKRTIPAAIREWIASGKQAMASAWNNLMNSFYNIQVSKQDMPLTVQNEMLEPTVQAPVEWGKSGMSEESATEGNLISRGKPVEKKPFAFGGPQQSIQKRLYSTSTTAMEPTVVDSGGQSEAQRESEDIIRKLQGENPWNYPKTVMGNATLALESPLAKQIEEFLEKNNANAIEGVVSHLLKNDQFGVAWEGQVILEKIARRSNAFALKLFPLLEKNINKVRDSVLIGIVLLQLPPEQLLEAENMRNVFFRETNGYQFIMNYKPESIAKLLPKDTIKIISMMRKICKKISENNSVNNFAGDKAKKRYDEFVSFFTKVFAEKFVHGADDDLWILIQELCEAHYFGEDLFQKLILSDSALKNTLVDYIKRNIKELSQTRQGLYTIDSFISFDPSIKDFLVDFIKKEQTVISQLLGGNNGREILKRLASDNIEVQKLISDYLRKETDPNIRFLISGDFLAKTLNGPDFIEIVLGIDSSYAQTPSYQHLMKFYQEIQNSEINFEIIVKTPNLKDMIHKIIRKEKELIEQGYEVFYHGRRWQYGFLSDIYRMLYEYKSGKELKDFIFTHLDDPVLGKVSERFFESEQKKRERLAAEGNPLSYETKTNPMSMANRQSLLFLNKFLFGNVHKMGSNSMYYILNNWNVGEISFSVEEIFGMFGCSDVYKAHEQELLALQRKYNALTQYGELLQIAIPKENIDKCVYYTTSGGPKLEFKMPDGNTTTDIKVISQELDRDPKANVEFVLINTRDEFGGLNPDYIKVFSYDLVDTDKMTAFKEEEKNEFAVIKQDLTKKDTQESVSVSENKETVSENKEAVEATP